MASTHFSGPLEVAGGFVGNLTGNVTGGVTGNVAGNVTGLVNTVNIVAVAGAPVAQATAKNTIVVDTTNSDLYINIGTLAVPDYKKITRAV